MKNSLNFHADSYDKNSNFYDKTYFFLNDYKGEARFIKKILKLNNTKLSKVKLLELGCGTGNFFSYLPKLQKTGIDISKNMIKVAKSKNILKSNFATGDISNLKIREKFDVIYISTFLIQTFKTFVELEIFLEKIKNNISEKGIILFSWIDEQKYRKNYGNEKFNFKLKNNWNCYGESYSKNKKRYIKLEFINDKNEKIKSFAKYLIFSEKYLQELSQKLKIKLKTYQGKNNGLREYYHKWAILKKL